jgi:hypothetical protein
MSRATEQYHDTNPAEQLSLLSQEELAALRSSSASRSRKGEIMPRKALHQALKERVANRSSATQPELPGIKWA